MQIKIPKTIFLAGRVYKIRKDPKLEGASFDGGKYLITIGTKFSDPQDKLEGLLHEILEIILLERGFRYSIYASINKGYRFVFDHKELEVVVRDLRAAIKYLLK